MDVMVNGRLKQIFTCIRCHQQFAGRKNLIYLVCRNCKKKQKKKVDRSG